MPTAPITDLQYRAKRRERPEALGPSGSGRRPRPAVTTGLLAPRATLPPGYHSRVRNHVPRIPGKRPDGQSRTSSPGRQPTQPVTSQPDLRPQPSAQLAWHRVLPTGLPDLGNSTHQRRLDPDVRGQRTRRMSMRSPWQLGRRSLPPGGAQDPSFGYTHRRLVERAFIRADRSFSRTRPIKINVADDTRFFLSRR